MTPIDALRTILSCAVGSAHFGTICKTALSDAVRALAPAELELLDRLGVLGLAETRWRELGIDYPQLLPTLDRYRELYALWNEVLLLGIRDVNDAAADARVECVLLKGPAYWDDLYTDRFARWSGDIDVLIKADADPYVFINGLRRKGFSCAEPLIVDNGSYRLPHFERAIALPRPCWYRDQCRERRHDRWSRVPVVESPSGLLTGTLTVEVHVSLFTLRARAPAPELSPDDARTASSSSWTGRVLADHAALPFSAVKLAGDLFHRQTGSIKLLRDGLLLLERMTQSEVAKSIHVAERWGVCGPLILFLNAVCDLMPTVEPCGLPRRAWDPIGETLGALNLI